jgi:peptidoglycan/LPS O-acetylase OafA/YrhL
MDSRAARSAPDGRHVPALDGVRAIAIVGVFLLHLAGAYVPGGAFGVDVFFVLSAFLITGMLLDEFDGSGRIRLGSFYARRAFRLAPALLLFLVLASFTAVLAGQAAKLPWSIAGTLLYFSDFLEAWTDWLAAAFNQVWSLAVEEQFYLVWPLLLLLVVLRLGRRGQRVFLAVSVLVGVALALTNPNYFLPTGHLLALMLGAWAADQRARGVTPWVARIARIPFIGLLPLAVFVAAALGENRLPGAATLTLVIAVDVAATLLVLSITVRAHDPVNRMLGSAVPRWIGARSYAIYLYGLTLIQLVPMLTGLRLTFAAPVDVVLTAVLVGLSYRFVEAPIRARGRRWLRGRELRAVERRTAGRPGSASAEPAGQPD